MRVLLFLFLILFSFSQDVTKCVVNRQYPLFSQCDGRWGTDPLGSSSTICAVRFNFSLNHYQVGCTMSSCSMGLSGLGIKIETETNPKSLNSWLMSNSGYSGNNLYWGKISEVALEYGKKELPWIGKKTCGTSCAATLNVAKEISDEICKGNIVILWVKSKSHWVLARGVKDGAFIVNDPGYSSKTEYPFTDTFEASIYDASNFPLVPIEIKSCKLKRKKVYYNKCDEKWKDILLGTSQETICSSGILVSTIAMGLASLGIELEKKTVDPKSLNKWLIDNNGFVSDNLFVWNSVTKVGSKNMTYVGRLEVPSEMESVRKHICDSNLVVLYTDRFLLAKGVTKDGDFNVLDATDESTTVVGQSEVSYAQVYDTSLFKTSSSKALTVILSVSIPLFTVFSIILCILIASILFFGFSGLTGIINLASKGTKGTKGSAKYERYEGQVD